MVGRITKELCKILQIRLDSMHITIAYRCSKLVAALENGCQSIDGCAGVAGRGWESLRTFVSLLKKDGTSIDLDISELISLAGLIEQNYSTTLQK